MTILIAVDKYKGSLTSVQVADTIQQAIKVVKPHYKTICVPMADGGEGTLQVTTSSLNGKISSLDVCDPLMRKVKAHYGISNDNLTGVIELAQASGLSLLKKSEQNPCLTTTFGTGELVSHLLSHNVDRIIIGMGGSATNDMGYGLMNALGLEALDWRGNPIKQGGIHLQKAKSINIDNLHPDVDFVNFICACDVMNPLIGDDGCTYTYALQKGADEDMVIKLEDAISHFATIIKKTVGVDVSSIPGLGAAGGTPALLYSLFSAEVVKGVDIIISLSKIEEYIENVDLIITGEGCLDHQTLQGKVPIGMSQLAQKHKIPIIAFVGSCTLSDVEIRETGFDKIYSIVDERTTREHAITNAKDLLSRKVMEAFK